MSMPHLCYLAGVTPYLDAAGKIRFRCYTCGRFVSYQDIKGVPLYLPQAATRDQQVKAPP